MHADSGDDTVVRAPRRTHIGSPGLNDTQNTLVSHNSGDGASLSGRVHQSRSTHNVAKGPPEAAHGADETRSEPFVAKKSVRLQVDHEDAFQFLEDDRGGMRSTRG